MSLSRTRRFALSIAAIGLAAQILRPQLAAALIIRGDGYLYVADTVSALREYRKAIAVDSYDSAAVDRFAFFAGTLHEPKLLAEAATIASRYLQRRPSDEVVRLDRAMIERRLNRNAEAMADFANVAKTTHDPAASTFAGYCALRIGAREKARDFWLQAIQDRDDYGPARHAIARYGWQP